MFFCRADNLLNCLVACREFAFFCRAVKYSPFFKIINFKKFKVYFWFIQIKLKKVQKIFFFLFEDEGLNFHFEKTVFRRCHEKRSYVLMIKLFKTIKKRFHGT